MLRFIRFPSSSTSRTKIVSSFNNTLMIHSNFRFCSSSQQQQLSANFLQTLQGILYKLSTTTSSLSPSERQPIPASPSRPRWVPLGVLGLKLPEHLVEEELDNYNGGLRAVIENTPILRQTCEISRDHITGVWKARIKPLIASPTGDMFIDQQSGGDTDRLAKLASIVSSKLLQVYGEMKLEIDDEEEKQQVDPNDIYLTIANLENMLDPPFLNKILEKYQHLNIALVEAEKWIPEASLCWTLQLREVKASSSWQQSVVGLKRDCKQSLDILLAMKESVAEFAVPEPQFNNSIQQQQKKKPKMTFSPELENESSNSKSSASVGGVPPPPPPPPGGTYQYIDETSAIAQGNSNNNDSSISNMEYNFGTSKYYSGDGGKDIDLDPSLIPPAPTQEQINEIYKNAQYTAVLENGQVYIPPNPSTVEALQGIALQVEDLMQFIPSFFIPIELALEQLAPLGYSQEHIDNYFSSIRCIQIIKSTWPTSSTTPTSNSVVTNTPSEDDHTNNNGENNQTSSSTTTTRQFIRIFAGGGKFDMTPILETNKRFSKFEPLPSLSRPFLKILSKPGSWMSVRDLLDLAGKEAEEALPFQGNDALLYFAQLQHIFVFSVERGGIVARRPQSQNFSLFSSTTPCPVFYNQLCRVMERNGATGRVHADAIPSLIQNQITLEEMQRCFPNWHAFAAAHREKFTFDPSKNELMFTSAYESAQRKELSLEEQLEYAMRTKNFTAVKQLKRKMATTRNPDNPLLDPERLAAAVAEFLPASSHIKVSSLLKSLPDEIRDLLPRAGLQRFIKRFPVYFTAFDYKHAGVRHVQRTGLPLPSGAVRNDFSKEEIVALCVQELQKKAGQRAQVANLLLKMPSSVIENLKRGAALAGILKEYSDCFVFVSSAGNVEVILVKPPNFVAAGEVMGGSNNSHQQEQIRNQNANNDFPASPYNSNQNLNNRSQDDEEYYFNQYENESRRGGFRPKQQQQQQKNNTNNNQQKQEQDDEWVTMAKESFGL